MIEQVVSVSGNEPVTIDAALRLQFGAASDKDTLIGNLISEARDYAERCTQRTLRDLVTRKILLCYFPSRIELPWPPALAISSIQYYDADGNSQTVSSGDYRLTVSTNGKASLEFDVDYSYPSLDVRQDAFSITYTTGYSSGVPECAASAIKLLTLAFYAQDSEVSQKLYMERADALLSTVAMPVYA